MKHLGDITRISGFEVPITDCVIGGSPCQGLSVAGQRGGLKDKRSGLFMEQIRIIKEMRASDASRKLPIHAIRPRFMVWENVPGAFSSNKGQDFRAVLEETVRIIDPDAPDIPLPPKRKWPMADCWYGDGWSIAYRVFDAQFWGVPQRRRRIALVADFGGYAAPEILFIRKSVCGDFGEGETPKEADTPGAVGSPDQTVYCIQGNCIDRADTAGCNGKGWTTDVSYTLNTIDRPAVTQPDKAKCLTAKGQLSFREDQDTLVVQRLYENHQQESRLTGPLEIAPTVAQKFGTGGNNTPLVMATGQTNAEISQGLCPTLNCNHEAPIISPDTGSFVRRLTPLECERLQGYPDGWTDIGDWIDSNGKLHKGSSDSARYKALGNSIALPPWRWVIKRLCGWYERPATMASLFDGIGGFPLIWEQFNGKGSCLWASEIEEFPIAVTKRHFPEEERK